MNNVNMNSNRYDYGEQRTTRSDSQHDNREDTEWQVCLLGGDLRLEVIHASRNEKLCSVCQTISSCSWNGYPIAGHIRLVKVSIPCLFLNTCIYASRSTMPCPCILRLTPRSYWTGFPPSILISRRCRTLFLSRTIFPMSRYPRTWYIFWPCPRPDPRPVCILLLVCSTAY